MARCGVSNDTCTVSGPVAVTVHGCSRLPVADAGRHVQRHVRHVAGDPVAAARIQLGRKQIVIAPEHDLVGAGTSMPQTYSGISAAMPSPRRWPIV